MLGSLLLSARLMIVWQISLALLILVLVTSKMLILIGLSLIVKCIRLLKALEP